MLGHGQSKLNDEFGDKEHFTQPAAQERSMPTGTITRLLKVSRESTRMAMRHINTSPAIVPAKCPGKLTAHFKLIKFEFKYKR